MELVRPGAAPAIRPPAARVPPVKATALPVPADLPQLDPIPPPIPGSFSILIDTFDNAAKARAVDLQLKRAGLAPYAIDLVLAPDDVRRRILLGRYIAREDADAVLTKLGPAFATARVILGSREHFKYEIP